MDPLFREDWKEKSQKVKSGPEEVPGVEETDTRYQRAGQGLECVVSYKSEQRRFQEGAGGQ